VILIVGVVVKESLPKIATFASGATVRLERYKRHRVVINDRSQVVARQIGFVSAHLADSEVASRGLDQAFELRRVGSVRVGNFDTRDYVGFDSAHQMHLDPVVSFHQFRIGVLGFRPLNKTTSSEAGRVNGEITFDSLQRQAANFDQLFQERRQGWILKVAGNRSVVRGFRKESLAVRVSQVRSETASRERRIDFERAGKDHVSQGNARTPERLDRFFDAFAEFIKQREKALLLVALRPVVGRPFLLVGFPDGDSLSDGLCLAVIGVLAANHYFSRVDVLASLLSCNEVRASALRVRGIRLDDVGVLTTFGLGRNKPSVPVVATLQFGSSGNHQAAFFSFLLFVHCVLTFLGKDTAEAYNSVADCIASAVWLNAGAEVDASASVAMVEGVGFEPTKPDGLPERQSGAINHSATPPLINFSIISSILLILSWRNLVALLCLRFPHKSETVGRRLLPAFHCRSRSCASPLALDGFFPRRNGGLPFRFESESRRSEAAQSVSQRTLSFHKLPLVSFLTEHGCFDNLVLFLKALQREIERCQEVFVFGNIEAYLFETLSNLDRRQGPILGLQYASDRIGQPCFSNHFEQRRVFAGYCKLDNFLTQLRYFRLKSELLIVQFVLLSKQVFQFRKTLSHQGAKVCLKKGIAHA
jgi:hypothetical protein